MPTESFLFIGGSPDQRSVGSGTKRPAASSSGRSRIRKEFLRRFLNSEILTEKLEGWFSSLSVDTSNNKPRFDAPFELTEIQKLDYALEGVLFQQLVRMPNPIYASTSNAFEASTYLALEDFLHASAKGLWEAFWSSIDPFPLSVASLHGENLEFCPAENSISSGKFGGLCATAIMLTGTSESRNKWDHILELALLRPDIKSLSMENDTHPSLPVMGEALFFALRVLLSRSLSQSKALRSFKSVFIILVDSQYGGVVKVEGDVNKFDFDVNNVYDSAAQWFSMHSRITVSSIDKIWNKLGNANWGDIGALQILLATFHCIDRFAGTPTYSVEDLASDHSSRLHIRRTERQLGETGGNKNGLFRFQNRSISPEIVEVQDESKEVIVMKLEPGSVLWLEDSDFQKGFQISEVLSNGEHHFYTSIYVEEPGKSLFLYVGSHPSQLEPAWEDMSLWYQVQRQTKILTIMKQRGFCSKYLPELVASGRIIHPGQCMKPSSGGNCDHPWCGTPILVTSPTGELVSDLVRNGQFGSEETLKCCHDCLSALSTAASAGIRHGDIQPENIIRVSSCSRYPYYVVTGWGHAVLEERDRPAMNLHFSSTLALQEGKLCSASDAESLVYLLYFSVGGVFPELDSVEGALQWRETSWSKRIIQQKLGEISAVLKAFADYVDSLCGTPYPMDYEIWLRRMRRNIHKEDHGKEIDSSG
ncbi:hypothetical protein GIB67_010467 [Kingdonia uniflora]|uniref:Protein kinase domain-containing protein n=1 Tax=Kingdonia uniflora TaxID=39325 RepID=A0A7J7MAH6_9MAGN|nr:hypothetical protein GIB67_010467 [Kingdonia uniflora]